MTGAEGERERAYRLWSGRHGGLDPTSSRWTAGWVRLTHAAAAPLARRDVAPDVVTVLGVVVTAVGVALVLPGGPWVLLAVPVLVLAAVLDGVDGALAARTGTTSAWGRVLDPLADRVCDLLLVLALVLAAGLAAPAVAAGAALGAVTLLLEGVRASAQVAGLRGPGALTVWERPSRVVVTCLGLLAAGLLPGALPGVLPGDTALHATGALGGGLVLALAGLTHLLVAVRRALRRADPPG